MNPRDLQAMNPSNHQRRTLLKTALGASLGAALPMGLARAVTIHTRPIPSSGEQIPAIGMGTWITFNVGDDPGLRAARCEVLEQFFALGGRMVDSSPMYGSAEAVVGECTSRSPAPEGYLPTTKVWEDDRQAGRRQIEDSFRLWNVPKIDVYQIHNLVGWRHHLPYLRELKEAGRVRYVGITTSHGRRHSELADIMEKEPLDFVQLTYNLQDRLAEKRLLPLARDKGVGVIVNRPFRRGALFDRLRGESLPGWAAEIGCTNMAQVMLKFIISHPAVTCAIPATSQIEHMVENMGALQGAVPDASLRKDMIRWFERDS